MNINQQITISSMVSNNSQNYATIILMDKNSEVELQIAAVHLKNKGGNDLILYRGTFQSQIQISNLKEKP